MGSFDELRLDAPDVLVVYLHVISESRMRTRGVAQPPVERGLTDYVAEQAPDHASGRGHVRVLKGPGTLRACCDKCLG